MDRNDPRTAKTHHAKDRTHLAYPPFLEFKETVTASTKTSQHTNPFGLRSHYHLL
jgi:hypothetical protein